MKKQKFIEILLLLVLSIPPLFWLRDSGTVVLGHDSGFRLDSFAYLKSLFYSWGSIANFGFDWSIFKGFLITQAPEALFSSLTGSLHSGQILTFIFWFFMIGLSMYIFVTAFFPQKEYWLFRLFAAAFYMYNFFVLQGWFIAERAKFSLFAALPLGLLILYKTQIGEYSILRGSILFALVFFFLNGGGFPSLYSGVLLVYSLAFAYLLIIDVLTKGVRGFLQTVTTVIAFFTATVFMSAYWLLPQLYLIRNAYVTGLSAQGGIQGIIAWEEVISKYASFANLFRLQGIPDWYNNAAHPYSNVYLQNPLLILSSFVTIVLILVGLYYYPSFRPTVRKERLFYLVFFIFLVGIIFTAGSHPPFGNFYLFLVKNIPGFAIFRSSLYKFGPALWFSLAFLSAYFLNFLLERFVRKRVLSMVLRIVAIVLLLVYHFPFFSNNFFSWNKPFSTLVTVPPYVTRMAAYINARPVPFSRILLAPPLHPYFKADSYTWGFWSLWPLPNTLITNTSIVANDSNGDQHIAQAIYDELYFRDASVAARMIGASGIDGVLWRDDVLYSNKVVTSNDLQSFLSTLQKLPGITREKKEGKWELYNLKKNPFFLPLFFVPERVDFSRSDIAYDVLLRRQNIPIRYALAIAPFGNTTPPFAHDLLVQASCVQCEENGITEMQKEVSLPQSRFLPDSLLYFQTALEEAILISSMPNDPGKQIDLQLTLANNRFAELMLLHKKAHTENTVQMSNQIVKRYKENIESALRTIKSLQEIQKNYYQMKMLSYLLAHRQSLINYKSSVENMTFFDLYAFFSKQRDGLEKQIWMTTSPEDRKYYVSVDEAGEYALSLPSHEQQPSSLFLDGKKLQSLERIHLSGVHKLEIRYPSRTNLLFSKQKENLRKVTLAFNNSVEYRIQDFSPLRHYLIRFRYKKNSGRYIPSFSVVQTKGSKGQGNTVISTTNFFLEENEDWNTFSFVLKPELAAESVSLRFIAQRFFTEDVTQMSLENFLVTEVPSHTVFFTKQLETRPMAVPEILYQKINQTKYRVKVRNARTPYLLSFGESFSPGWKVYQHSDSNFITKPVASYFSGEISEYAPASSLLDKKFFEIFSADILPEQKHFRVNGYANGWYIDKTGDYELLVEYAPQRFVYLGVIISILTLLSFSTILVLLHIRYEKKKK